MDKKPPRADSSSDLRVPACGRHAAIDLLLKMFPGKSLRDALTRLRTQTPTKPRTPKKDT